ncbi:MAG: hypothetical protein ACK5Z5_01260 [Neisseriaceae bacterium]
MDIVSHYIKSIALVYDSESYTSIIGDNGDILYLSELMRKLVSSNTNSTPNTLKGFDYIPKEIIDELEHIHNKIIQQNKSLKYIYMGENSSGEFMLFRGTKYPIHNKNNHPIAIFTLEYKLKSININNQNHDYSDYSFSIPNFKLSDIEQLILFYTSFGFSHGEAYYFIIKFTNSRLKMDNFKYYHKQLLKKFNAKSIAELIDSVDELKMRRFIPQKLLKNAIFLIKD